MMMRFSDTIKEKHVGMIFGWVGIWLIFVQGVVVPWASKRFSSERILMFSILGLGLALPCHLIPQINPWFVLIVSPFVALFQGLTSPNLTTVVTKHAGPEEQGEILGINQSMVAVGHAAPPLIAGYLTGIDASYPILISGFVVVAAWVVYMSIRK